MGITTGGGVNRGLAPKLNLTAIVPPTATDDITKGYTEGSVWVDTVLNVAYTCLEDAPGAAIWTSQGGLRVILAASRSDHLGNIFTTDMFSVLLLEDILKELKIMNIYNAIAHDHTVSDKDIGAK